MKNKGLGRGLDALLSNEESDKQHNTEGLTMLSITKLVSGQYQPRKTMNQQHLDELAESIKSQE